MNTLKFIKIRDVKTPCRAHADDAGIDFFVPCNVDFTKFRETCETTNCYPDYDLDENNCIVSVILKPGESILIPSGIKVNVPSGYALIFMNKSGVAAKKHLLVGSAVVDENYMGECHINLHNAGNDDAEIQAGDKIVQGLVIPINYCMPEEIDSEENLYKDKISNRGAGGFGSTGNS